MPPVLINEVKHIALSKQFLKHIRMQKITRTAVDLKQSEDMHRFHTQALQALIRLHPHASKRILTSLSNQF
jgi:hypothetical protein